MSKCCWRETKGWVKVSSEMKDSKNIVFEVQTSIYFQYLYLLVHALFKRSDDRFVNDIPVHF